MLTEVDQVRYLICDLIIITLLLTTVPGISMVANCQLGPVELSQAVNPHYTSDRGVQAPLQHEYFFNIENSNQTITAYPGDLLHVRLPYPSSYVYTTYNNFDVEDGLKIVDQRSGQTGEKIDIPGVSGAFHGGYKEWDILVEDPGTWTLHASSYVDKPGSAGAHSRYPVYNFTLTVNVLES